MLKRENNIKWILIGLLAVSSISYGADTIQYTKPSDSGVTIPILTAEPREDIGIALSDEQMDENAPKYLKYDNGVLEWIDSSSIDFPDHVEVICADDKILKITVTGENAVIVDCEVEDD